ncbi:MAG: SCO2521 family protein [Pseudonocardiaceae bacterium]
MPTVLVVGEVRTCLLHNEEPLSRAAVAQLLELVPGQRVLSADRPIGHSVSPQLTVGVDCRLAATSSKIRARGIGTVTSYALITAGLVLQSSAKADVRRAVADQRLTWSHYLAQPGAIEVIIRPDTVDLATNLATGYLTDTSPIDTLDLGAVSEHLIGDVQMRPQLDHITSVRARPTRVRWAARLSDSDTPSARVHVVDDVLRTLELTVHEDQLGQAARFCEDFALHDWLLTTLGQIIEQANRTKAAGGESIEILSPVIERLLHLWMPGAHVDPVMRRLWGALEQRPGFSLQWNAQVARIRDQIALQTLQALQQAKNNSLEW